MAVPEPSDNVGLWESVKRYTFDQVWPPDDEADAWALARQWQAVAKLMDDTATELEAQAKVSETVWVDDAGAQFAYALRSLPKNFRLIARSMSSLADGIDDYGDSLREARINIVMELVANIVIFAALAWMPGGGFLAQGLARIVAGRLTSMITSLAGRALSGGLPRALELVAHTGVEMGKEAIDEALINAATQLTSMAMGTRDSFDFAQLGQNTLAGALGGPLGEVVGKAAAPLSRATGAGLDQILPSRLARNLNAGLTSAANNAVTSPTAGYLAQNIDNPSAWVDPDGYAESFKQNAISSALVGAPRSMVVDGVQQWHPHGQQTVDDLVNRFAGNAAGAAPPDTSGLRGGDPAGGAGSSAGEGGGDGGQGGQAGGNAGSAQAGGGQAGGAQAGGEAGGAQGGGAQSGGQAGGAQADGAQTGGAQAAQGGGAQGNGAQSGGQASGAQAGQAGGGEASGAQTDAQTGEQAGGGQAGQASGAQAGQAGGGQAGGAQAGGHATGAQGTGGAEVDGTQAGGEQAAGAQASGGHAAGESGASQTDTGGTHANGQTGGASTGSEAGTHSDVEQTGSQGSQPSGAEATGQPGHAPVGEAGGSQHSGASQSQNVATTGDPGQSNSGVGQTTAPMGSAPTHAAGAAPTHTTSSSNAGTQGAGTTANQSTANQSATNQSGATQQAGTNSQPNAGQTGNTANSGNQPSGPAAPRPGTTQQSGSAQTGNTTNAHNPAGKAAPGPTASQSGTNQQGTSGRQPGANPSASTPGAVAGSETSSNESGSNPSNSNTQPSGTKPGGNSVMPGGAAAVSAAAAATRAAASASTSPDGEQARPTAKPAHSKIGGPPSGNGTNAGPEVSVNKIRKDIQRAEHRGRNAEVAARNALDAAAEARAAVLRSLAEGTEAAARAALAAVKKTADKAVMAENKAYVAEVAAANAKESAERAAGQRGGRVSEMDIARAREAAAKARESAEKALDAAIEAWQAATPDGKPPPARGDHPVGGDPGRQPDDPAIPVQPEVHTLGTYGADRLTVVDGVITEIDKQPVAKVLRALARQRAELYFRAKLAMNPTGRATGDVVAVVLNVRTGQVFESTNGQTRTEITPGEHVHEKLRAREAQLRRPDHYPQWNDDGTPAPGPRQDLPGLPNEPLYRHAEVRAANEHLHAHDDAELADLLADVWFTQADGPVLAPFCANCSGVLEDVGSVSGRRVYTEDGGAPRIDTLPPALPGDPPTSPPNPAATPVNPRTPPATPTNPANATPPTATNQATTNPTATNQHATNPNATNQHATNPNAANHTAANPTHSAAPTNPSVTGGTRTSTTPTTPRTGTTNPSPANNNTTPTIPTTPRASTPSGRTATAVTNPNLTAPTTRTPNTGPANPPAPGPNTSTPGPRQRVHSVRSVPGSAFAVRENAGPNHIEVATWAHRAMDVIAEDAGVRAVRQISWSTFEVTRMDGSTFVALVVSAETNGGNLAEIRVADPDGRVEIRVSSRLDPGNVERTVADAVAQASAVLNGVHTTTDVLDANTTPAAGAELSAADRGRQAEVRNLDRAARRTPRYRLVRRRRIANEMRALVDHLGLHPDDPGAPRRRALSDVGHIVDRHVKPGDRHTSTPPGPAPPPPPTVTGTPGPRGRVDSVRALPHSRFAADPQARARWAEVQDRARQAVRRVAGDAGIAGVTQRLGRPFEITRTDGSRFTATVHTYETSDGSPAELRLNAAANHVDIRVSPRVRLDIVERTIANAVAQASAALAGAQTNTNLLDGATHPGNATELSAEDHGRQAEVRHLDRTRQETARLRVVRRRRIAAEMKALVEHLGLHPDDQLAGERRALSDVNDTVDQHVRAGGRRPAWVLPPDGYPRWSAFLVNLTADVVPGFAAGAAIAWLADAPIVGAATAAATAAAGVSGTFVRHWYDRLNKTNTDTGHGDAIKIRAHEQALARKRLLDPLLARMRGVPADRLPRVDEPAPRLDNPPTHLPYWQRFIGRGLPAILGAGAATTLVPAGLPGWVVLAHWGVAGVTAGLGPIVEKYFRTSLIAREWALLDNVGRQQDATAAAFDRLFVAQLNALYDRIENLTGASPTGTVTTSDNVPEHPVGSTTPLHYGAEQAAGNLTNLARAAADAAKAFFADHAADVAANALKTGGLRVAVGTLVNAFLDRNFVTNEYKEIVSQVHHDFGNKMAEQVALEQRILTEMLADLTARVDLAEAAVHRVDATLASRVADLLADAPPAPVPADPADRPRGYQRFRAFLKLHVEQVVVMETAAAGAVVAFNQDPVVLGILGAVAAGVLATFPARYLFRQRGQWAVDETIHADRAKERPVERAQAAAARKFAVEQVAPVIDAAVAGRPAPHSAPPKPELSRDIDARIRYERALLAHEPRPWSTTNARLVALDRLTRIAGRVRAFDAHARATGDTRALDHAREELRKVWDAYQKLKNDGTPMPPDYEILKPEGMRGGRPGTRPAEDLRSYLDDSMVTPAGRAFYPPGEVPDTAHALPREHGRYTLDLHGGPDFVRIGADRLTADDLAALVEADPNWHGEPIRLLACETGQKADGFAQRLADRLGVTVHAPTEMVGIDPDGNVYVASLTVNEAGMRVPGPPGRMRAFEPTVRPDPLPTVHHAMYWPDRPEVRIGDVLAVPPAERLGELTRMLDGPTVYTGAERLWPDELADAVTARGDWRGGPTRLQVRDGHVDPEFVQRLADLLGQPVVVPAKAVSGEFPTLSSGTIEVYNEPASAGVPPGCRVYEPRSVSVGKGSP